MPPACRRTCPRKPPYRPRPCFRQAAHQPATGRCRASARVARCRGTALRSCGTPRRPPPAAPGSTARRDGRCAPRRAWRSRPGRPPQARRSAAYTPARSPRSGWPGRRRAAAAPPPGAARRHQRPRRRLAGTAPPRPRTTPAPPPAAARWRAARPAAAPGRPRTGPGERAPPRCPTATRPPSPSACRRAATRSAAPPLVRITGRVWADYPGQSRRRGPVYAQHFGDHGDETGPGQVDQPQVPHRCLAEPAG